MLLSTTDRVVLQSSKLKCVRLQPEGKNQNQSSAGTGVLTAAGNKYLKRSLHCNHVIFFDLVQCLKKKRKTSFFSFRI